MAFDRRRKDGHEKYQEKREEALQRVRERKRDVYALVPAVKEIDEALSLTAYEGPARRVRRQCR
jgi:hypothetical protein